MSDIIKSDTGLSKPDWMTGMDATGTENLGAYIVPPRLKIIQKTADEQYASQFKEGDAVLVPQQMLLVNAGDPFFFTPVFFYVEYLTMNPIETKGTIPFIHERSLDPKSDIAKKARDQDLRYEPFPDQPKLDRKHVEIFNFISVIHGREDVAGMPVCIGFANAEHRVGAQLAGLIKFRKAPIYGCVFQGMVPTSPRRNAKGSWYGLDVGNPTESAPYGPFIDSQESFNDYEELHTELKKAFDEERISVNYEDETAEEESDTSVDADAAEKF